MHAFVDPAGAGSGKKRSRGGAVATLAGGRLRTGVTPAHVPDGVRRFEPGFLQMLRWIAAYPCVTNPVAAGGVAETLCNPVIACAVPGSIRGYIITQLQAA